MSNENLLAIMPPAPQQQSSEQESPADAIPPAIGEAAAQLKAIVDAPGVSELLKAVAHRYMNGDAEVLARIKNEHERAMQADQLQADQTRRRDGYGMKLLYTGAGVFVAVVASVSALAIKGVITADSATHISGAVVAVLAAVGVTRRAGGGK